LYVFQKPKARIKTNKSGDIYQQINSGQFLTRSGKAQFAVALPEYGETPPVSSALARIWESNGDKMDNKRDEKRTWETGGKEKN
jgi:hypothetical protein